MCLISLIQSLSDIFFSVIVIPYVFRTDVNLLPGRLVYPRSWLHDAQFAGEKNLFEIEGQLMLVLADRPVEKAGVREHIQPVARFQNGQ